MNIKSDFSPDTSVSWTALNSAAASDLAGYRIYWRRTAAPMWDNFMYVGSVTQHNLENIVIDNWYFVVASVSKDGYESPTVIPGPGGAF